MVKDPPNGVPSVPGVLGMNIIKECYWELFVLHGPALVDLPSVLQAPLQIQQALQQCHQAKAPPVRSGQVKVKGRRVCRVPGGTMKIVMATCSKHYLENETLFEPCSQRLPQASWRLQHWSV